MADWQRIDDLELDESEQAAVETVFRLLIPTDVAEWEWSPVRFAASVHNRERLATLIGVPIGDVVEKVESFELDGELMLSPVGTLMIAERACQVNPLPVLAHVIEEEKELREKVKRGGRHMSAIDREEVQTSPEWEYHWYLTNDRPRHELLRQWCGHRAVTFQERLLAAEAENRRLDVLVAEVIDALKRAGDEYGARAFEEEHERDRITPERARPIVDRPLAPSEIPIQYVTARRRWGY
ncbi:hypothetical protein [Humibacter sp. RRB41]|uniref:hypothetical protein n=1 Tax=Humibacter sp. RRB41 TaxID=2919946 RepID=UPI001FA9C06E|nr:hypothetical protein [Humibacter sp. RRB41]